MCAKKRPENMKLFLLFQTQYHMAPKFLSALLEIFFIQYFPVPLSATRKKMQVPLKFEHP